MILVRTCSKISHVEFEAETCHVSLFEPYFPNLAELIMAVGLVVDYMVHVVHYFLHQVRRVSRKGVR